VILVLSLAIGVLFGAGAYLLLKPDLFRVIVGVVLVSHAANLALMSSGLTRGKPPIYPLPFEEEISDPLVQALTLTAIVIGFAVTTLLLGLVVRVYRSHFTPDLDEVRRAEAQREAELEREEVSV
jgi:multicomponent Na+:H+ antiporter subunit C